ncbi:MAG: RNA polymerase sigma factor [Bacteroidales bacterium]|nr:RNA polymerase sigma factor [Bacteroidales bacterium]
MNKTEFKYKVFALSEHLFPMVSRMLGNYADAEDAIQEIMIKLWAKRKQIGQHPNISGFVFLTARNYCIDLMRKKRLEIYDYPLQLEILKSENGQEQLEWKELNAVIKNIIESLPEQQRKVIMMRDIDGYEFIEITAATQLNIEHVRVLLSRARKEVSIKLGKTYSYERG